ncbi:subtilase-type protease inhibitor [Streptomyces sp. NPDC127178]|uniref:subtilase-type protease inhibitor n=1 Tax=unclassified Streptomyces TaxID=2593676 RepID=UPI00362826BB
MRKFTGLVATVLAAAGIAAAAPSAHAGPDSLYAPSALVITTARGDGSGAVGQAVTLSCTGRPMGTHPAPASACQELSQTAGDFNALVTDAGDQPCIMIYAPVTVSIQGIWQGQRISWERTFTNACERQAALRGSTVFAL